MLGFLNVVSCMIMMSVVYIVDIGSSCVVTTFSCYYRQSSTLSSTTLLFKGTNSSSRIDGSIPNSLKI